MPNLHDHDCGGCCPGPVGPIGPQGIQGIQGVVGPQGQAGQTGLQGNVGPAGPKGADGLAGAQGPAGKGGVPGPMGLAGPEGATGTQGQAGQTGAVGPAGPQGLQGLQGLQGVPGTCIECPCGEIPEFAEAYSSQPQTLAPSMSPNASGGVVLFENLIVSTANIDASTTATDGKFKIKLAGWYDVASGITGNMNPIPAPLPVFTVSIFLNNVIVPGSTFSNVPLSPAQSSSEITADTYVYCNVGDEILLANTSTSTVFLTAPSLGTNAQTNSAYLKIQLLRAGAK